jgi:hypothetical protein
LKKKHRINNGENAKTSFQMQFMAAPDVHPLSPEFQPLRIRRTAVTQEKGTGKRD